MSRFAILLSLLAMAGLTLAFSGCGGQPESPPPPPPPQAAEASTMWTCSMHPQIQVSKPGDCPICGMKLIPTTETSDEPEHGEDAEHGEHIDHGDEAQHEGHSEYEEALAQLSEADRALAEKQKTCPVSGDPLGAMGKPYKVTVKEQEVLLCCPGCEDDFKKNPDEYLAKLNK